ncbi:helix-turn-helix domain-containing protein [Companilactobacillus paralimentarius]|uniref:helix-turn-helix domain-containing protein n=1 Tax=Companilactobacillus paralimentarius TaxID=83526 RepID=UPI0037E065A5
MNNLSIILGQRLLTIGDVSTGTGLNRNTVSSIYHRKSNNVKLKTLIKICDYLQIPLSELIEYKPSENNR